jgi:hypothetical protein
MAIRGTPQGLIHWPNDVSTTSQVALGTFATLTTAANKCAWIMPIYKTGNIIRVYIRLISTGASSGGDYRLRMEQVDTTLGPPSRPFSSVTLLATNTSAIDTLANSETVLTRVINLQAPAPVTEGQHVAIVYECPGSGTISTLVARFATGGSVDPHAITWNGSSWSNPHTGFHVIAVEYDDGYIPEYPGCYPCTMAQENYSSASTPDERGNSFRFPGSGRIWGINAAIDPDATDGSSVRLYDENLNLVTSAALSRRDRSSTASGFTYYKFPDSMPAYYKANKKWYVTIYNPTGGAVGSTVTTALSATVMQSYWGGSNMIYCTRTGLHTSGFAETSDKKYFIGLVFDLIEDGNRQGRALGKGLA